MEAKEGDDVFLENLGLVHVLRAYPSGAAIVRAQDGQRWLVPADVFEANEISLWSFKRD